jgi:hypothetical protein
MRTVHDIVNNFLNSLLLFEMEGGAALAGEQGEALAVSGRTLWQRMRERGLLATWDAESMTAAVNV